jgi:hypothetical protein
VSAQQKSGIAFIIGRDGGDGSRNGSGGCSRLHSNLFQMNLTCPMSLL